MCIHVRLPKASDRLGSDRSPFKLAHRKLLRECCCWFSISVYTSVFCEIIFGAGFFPAPRTSDGGTTAPDRAALTATVAARAAVLEVEKRA